VPRAATIHLPRAAHPGRPRGSRVPRSLYLQYLGHSVPPRDGASARSLRCETVTVGSATARATSPREAVDREPERDWHTRGNSARGARGWTAQDGGAAARTRLGVGRSSCVYSLERHRI